MARAIFLAQRTPQHPPHDFLHNPTPPYCIAVSVCIKQDLHPHFFPDVWFPLLQLLLYYYFFIHGSIYDRRLTSGFQLLQSVFLKCIRFFSPVRSQHGSSYHLPLRMVLQKHVSTVQPQIANRKENLI